MSNVEEFKKAVQDSVAAREGASLIEIRDLAPASALVVVQHVSESTPSLYRLKCQPSPNGDDDLTWDYLGDVQI